MIIGKLFPKAEKKYRIAEDKKEAGSVYIDWENDKDPYVKSHSKMIDKLNNSGKIITHTGSAGNDTKLFTNSYDILMKNINNEISSITKLTIGKIADIELSDNEFNNVIETYKGSFN